jgi:predicted nucleotidyltransferase component of viral defense system
MQIKLTLKKVVEDNYDKPDFYIRNLLREYLQILVLRYIYSSEKYKELVFYGGTCLSHCYNLPRLSEDLDFVDLKKEVKLRNLAEDIKYFLNNITDIPVDIKIQKFRIYLKFPILKELGLSKGKEQSDYLFVKVEVFSDFDFCSGFKTEIKPIFKFNQSLFVKTFDISTLMSTKIRAVLYRTWEKTNKKGEAVVKVKGRDFFDLMWFLQNKIEPNFLCIEKINNKNDLKAELLKKIEIADEKSITLDLKNFLEDDDLDDDFGKNIKETLRNELERW